MIPFNRPHSTPRLTHVTTASATTAKGPSGATDRKTMAVMTPDRA